MKNFCGSHLSSVTHSFLCLGLAKLHPVQAIICSSSDFLFCFTHFLIPVACEPSTDFEIKVNDLR